MAFELMGLNNSLLQKYAVQQIVECNEFTAQYGLALTQTQAVMLASTRAASLTANGRVEFGGGVIDKIIKEFCDSPYISMANYTDTLNELIDMFYAYKNDALDLITDDELIKFMHTAFDGVCQGSLDLLSGRELAQMASNLRFGKAADYQKDDELSEKDENGEY
ncbi:MAG: DUF6323 family protein [Oscillospiraceae bacterium]